MLYLFSLVLFNSLKSFFFFENDSLGLSDPIVFKLTIYSFYYKSPRLPILSHAIEKEVLAQLLEMPEFKNVFSTEKLGSCNGPIKLVTKHIKENANFCSSDISSIKVDLLLTELFSSEPLFFSFSKLSDFSLYSFKYKGSNPVFYLISIQERLLTVIQKIPPAENQFYLIGNCILSGIIVNIHVFVRMWTGWSTELIHVPLSSSWTLDDLLLFLQTTIFNGLSQVLGQKNVFTFALWSSEKNKFDLSIKNNALITSIVELANIEFVLSEIKENSNQHIAYLPSFKMIKHSLHLLLSEEVLAKFNLPCNITDDFRASKMISVQIVLTLDPTRNQNNRLWRILHADQIKIDQKFNFLN